VSAASSSALARLWHTIVERVSAFEVPPVLRRPLRLAGYPLFAFFIAVLSFAIALPRDKVKERLEFLLSQDPTASQPMGLGMDVKAGELSLSILGRGIHADNVVLRTRPLRSSDKPARFVLDAVDVNVGLFGLLLARPTYGFSVSAFGGSVDGGIRVATTGNNYDIEAREVALASIQGLQTAIGGLPLEGKVEGKVELDAPGRMLSTSNGSIEITIDGVALGDGKAKLVIPSDPFLAGGLTVPKVRLGKLGATITIEKGKARIESFRAHSADVDVSIEGHLDLRDPFPSSQLHLFLRVKLSEELLKRQPELGILTTSLQPGKRPDGFFGAQITGSIASPRFEANRNPPSGVSSKFAAETAAAVPPPAPTPPPSTPPPGIPSTGTTVPPPPPPTEAAAPVDIPSPEKPTTIQKDGPIPPPPAMRAAQRGVIPAEGVPRGEDGTPPTPAPAAPTAE